MDNQSIIDKIDIINKIVLCVKKNPELRFVQVLAHLDVIEYEMVGGVKVVKDPYHVSDAELLRKILSAIEKNDR